jgi:CRISPR/Cas system-associated protein Cas10 (large subunit of type III CRISPR-Cas system)
MRRGIQKTAKREAKKKSDLKFKQQLSLTLACFSEEKSKESQNRLLEEKRILKSVLEDFVEAEEKLHSDIDSVFTSASQTTIRNVVEGPLSGFTTKIRDKLLKIDDDIARM